MTELPLVSCLCVTRKRCQLLKRALKCFQKQTHPHRELVVLCEDDDIETLRYVEQRRAVDERIRGVLVPAELKLPLGALRNWAIKAAQGDYICQWDDDDWYHKDRIRCQLNALIKSDRPACVLGRWIVFNDKTAEAYWSRWRAWEGSLLWAKSQDIEYPPLRRGEDTPVIDQLITQGRLTMLDQPELYVYIYHGCNTWDERHWRKHLRHRRRLSPELNRHIAQCVQQDAI